MSNDDEFDWTSDDDDAMEKDLASLDPAERARVEHEFELFGECLRRALQNAPIGGGEADLDDLMEAPPLLDTPMGTLATFMARRPRPKKAATRRIPGRSR